MGAKPQRRVLDHFWLWGHEAGSHNTGWGVTQTSRMTPVEATTYLGIPNLILVVYGGKPEPPFDQAALAMRPLKQVVWSIVGDAGSKRNDQATDLDEVLRLADRFPNITGAMMDDFFYEKPDAQGTIARYSVADLTEFRRRLHGAARPLDLWVVVYIHQLHMPLTEHLRQCDVVTLWTPKSEDTAKLPDNLARLEALTPPGVRKVLGCYLWDYGVCQPMPLAAFQEQYRLGRAWLEEGRIDGMIFLASCICDLELDTVEWLRGELAKEVASGGGCGCGA